jgi:hypothetical protein
MNTLRKSMPWIPILVSALALCGSILGVVWAASGERAAARSADQVQARAVDDHEERLRSVERELPAIAENVRITRATVERIERQLGGSP